jgi:hypothetical protein
MRVRVNNLKRNIRNFKFKEKESLKDATTTTKKSKEYACNK